MEAAVNDAEYPGNGGDRGGGHLWSRSSGPGSLAALYVDKILKGAKAADVPVEQLMKVEMVINFQIAKGLGLRIPQSLLLRADDVIQ